MKTVYCYCVRRKFTALMPFHRKFTIFIMPSVCQCVKNAAAALGSVAAAAGVAPVVVRTQMLNVSMLIFVDALGAGSVMK